VFRAHNCTDATFRVMTGHNIFENLRIRNANVAFELWPGADAGHNVIRNVLITNDNVVPGELVRVGSDDNELVANALSNESGIQGVNAIHVAGENNRIAMNGILGPFSSSVFIESTNTGTTRFDHNTIRIDGSGSTGVTFTDVNGLCYRNNIVADDPAGAPGSTGLALTNIDLESAAACDGVATGNNVNHGHQTACMGPACAALCTDGGPLCDRPEDPALLNDELCIDAASALVDTGTDLGYDMLDFAQERYNGAAPEPGARETASMREYGGFMSTCP
jgi:hypothetical protein